MALARILMKDYDLLILDEPTASMDQASIPAAEKMISEYRERTGCTVLLITHSSEQAQRIEPFSFFVPRSCLYFGRKNPKTSTIVYSVIAIIFIFIGTIASNDLVWELTDMFNNLMVIPNVIALFALTRIVIECVKEGKEKRQLKNR